MTASTSGESAANLTSEGVAGQHNAMIAARYHIAWKLCAKLRRAMVKTCHGNGVRWRNRAAVARPEVLIRHTATKTNAAVITQPSSLFETDSPPPAESRGELDSWIMVGADGLGSKEDVRVFSLMGAVLDAAPG